LQLGCNENTIVGNNVNHYSVTTPYDILEPNNYTQTQVGGAAYFDAYSIAMQSKSAPMTLLGTSATYPFIFKDGGGNIIAGINNAGAFITAPLP
jgi:hypothetical protein